MTCHHRARRSRLGLLTVLTWALTTPTAGAAPSDVVERARALFAQAESDEDAERWSDALEKFRAIAQVKLTAGVRYHIALCEDHIGQLVRALGDYREAEDQARLENSQDVLRIVGNQVAALDRRVPRLVVRVVEAPSEVSVKLDGQLVATGPAGISVPVDPGVHYVVATAPNRLPAAAAVTLRESESRTVELSLEEQLRDASSAPLTGPAARTTSPIRRAPPTSRVPASVATTLAVVLGAGGAAAFIVAGAERDSAVRTCALIPSPSPDACDWLKNRVRAWDFTAASAWGGALIGATAAIVLWAQPSGTTTRLGASSATPGVEWVVAPSGAGVRGRF